MHRENLPTEQRSFVAGSPWSSPVIAFEEFSGTFPTFNQSPQWLVWSKQFSKIKCVLSTYASLPNCAAKMRI
jgi:hypothetical protein